MNTKKLYPLVFCTDIDRARDFYAGKLGCRTTIDVPGYIQFAFGEGEDAPELAFSLGTLSAHFGIPLEAFGGKGLTFSIPVDDVDAHCATMAAKGLEIASPPADRPWGWRSYVTVDPFGVMLDFCKEAAQAKSADAQS